MTHSNWIRMSIGLTTCLLIAPKALPDDQRTPQTASEVDVDQADLIDFDKFALPLRIDPRLESIPIPESIRLLSGRRVQIRLIMLPQLQSGGLSLFTGSPEIRQIHHQRPDGEACIDDPLTDLARYRIGVFLKEGTTIDWQDEWTRRPLLIEGELEILDDPIDFEMGPLPFFLKDATFREVQPQEGFGPLWYWGGC